MTYVSVKILLYAKEAIIRHSYKETGDGKKKEKEAVKNSVPIKG